MAGSGRISVFASEELRTLLAAVKQVPREVRKNVRTYTKKNAQPIWQEEVRGRIASRLDDRVLGKTARVAVSDQNVMLQSGRIGKALTGGAKPAALAGGVEFGANRDERTTYETTSRKGKRYTVTRHTKRQLPSRNTNGRVIHPAARAGIPRFAKLWIQTAARTLYDAMEGK
ncbi:hypothetical protein [Curtobacterium flaccumfaciens]|uniref:hypothetical protein n=1 Tax=Curtobacterium flaccumfaciens TaxID=2035 RepID=UPI001BDDCC6B|nr:hypothetical protein [Curtobacterium flaccumfaciens]MBT1633763.1 hypothetical protein [Curtobacterium flaccumfaciens pv. oortii]MCX2845567.1 hypothetical protein [Curtobacterium flaccumfaciens pv. oortii]